MIIMRTKPEIQKRTFVKRNFSNGKQQSQYAVTLYYRSEGEKNSLVGDITYRFDTEEKASRFYNEVVSLYELTRNVRISSRGLDSVGLPDKKSIRLSDYADKREE